MIAKQQTFCKRKMQKSFLGVVWRGVAPPRQTTKFRPFILKKAGGAVPHARLAPHLDFIDKPVVTWWAPATTAKYLGAVIASSAAPGGADAEKARELFRSAADGLPIDSTGVLRKIAMTVRAEAFRSLRDLFPDEASGYLSEARALINGIPDRDGRWRAWLDAPGKTPFPGLSYWY